MKRIVHKLVYTAALMLPVTAIAGDQTAMLKGKIDTLSQQLEILQQQMKELQQKESVNAERVTGVEKKAQDAQAIAKKAQSAISRPAIEINGDYRARFDAMKGTSPSHFSFNDVMPWMNGGMVGAPPPARPTQDYKNDALLTNRFALDIKARATEDVAVKARLLMYKIWGHESSSPATGTAPLFADKFFVFDGNVGHIPQDSIMRVDQAYATWSGIANAPVWFSIGRRPSTGGVPTNLRQNIDKAVTETAGVPGLAIDYAFDGATIGFAPDIDILPGAYGKLCYGKGFDSGITTNNMLKDVNFLGINIVPYATDNFRLELQWDRAYDIFAYPETTTSSIFGDNVNLGDIDQFLIGMSGKIENLGPGDLNLFLSSAISKTHPNDNLAMGVAGLMYDAPTLGGNKESKSGTAFYVGGRYDIKSLGTKLGVEYNRGSKNWVSFTPAADDMWTAKQGVHGDVYEIYLIHEIDSPPVAKLGKAQIRLGYQYYNFEYTGSNNWLGAPKKIADLGNMMNAQMLTPLEDARNVYLTFDVMF